MFRLWERMMLSLSSINIPTGELLDRLSVLDKNLTDDGVVFLCEKGRELVLEERDELLN
jgi:hypothetical protein